MYESHFILLFVDVYYLEHIQGPSAHYEVLPTQWHNTERKMCSMIFIYPWCHLCSIMCFYSAFTCVTYENWKESFWYYYMSLFLKCLLNCFDITDQNAKQMVRHKFRSSMAHDIGYAMLCVFSYVAAARSAESMSRKELEMRMAGRRREFLQTP